jgi:hypothetical protein
MPDAPVPAVDASRVIGLDLGLKDFALLSDGERIVAPNFRLSLPGCLPCGAIRISSLRLAVHRLPSSNSTSKARNEASGGIEEPCGVSALAPEFSHQSDIPVAALIRIAILMPR